MINRKCAAKLIVILFFVFLIKPLFAETEEPKLRWEYKYQEGECLKYWMEGKTWLTPAIYPLDKGKKELAELIVRRWDAKSEVERDKMGDGYKETVEKFRGFIETGTYESPAGYSREVEAVLGVNVYAEIEKGKRKVITWTKLKKEGERDMQWHSSNKFGEGVNGVIEFGVDGNTKGLTYMDIFFLGQPQFLDSGLDLWSKDIHTNEALGQVAGSKMTFTAHYRKLGEEVIDGEKCVIIETEIGRVPNGTKEERGTIVSITGGENRIELYSKSFFSPDKGRVMKMDAELIMYENGKETFGDKFHFKLLNEKDIKKLDGIEEDWELVLADGGYNALTFDGKIIFTRDETIKEKQEDGTEKEVKKSFIYICEGDGSNRKKLTEGKNPKVSPDGKRIVFDFDRGEKIVLNAEGKEIKVRDIKQKAIDMEGKENKDLLKNIDLEASSPSWEFSWESVKKKVSKISGDFSYTSWGIFMYYDKWWNDKHKKVIFKNKEGKFYWYDLITEKLKELPELEKLPIGMASFSSSNLILAYSPVATGLEQGNLIYFNEDGKMLKTKVILTKEDKPVELFRGVGWFSDGNYLRCYRDNKAYIYSIRSEKIIWENPRDGELSSDYKYIYSQKIGNFIRRSTYRVPVPKELQDKIARGE